MKRLVFNKFPSVLFHRAILLMLLGVTFCMTLFVLRRRHVIKGITQTNNDRFNIKDIRIKPFEGLKTDEIYFPSTTFSWYSTTYSLPLSSSTTTTSSTTEGGGNSAQNNAKQSQSSESVQSQPDDKEGQMSKTASTLNDGDSSLINGTGSNSGKTFTNGAKKKTENIDLKALRDAALRKKAEAVSVNDKGEASDKQLEGSRPENKVDKDSVVKRRAGIPSL